ncbi:MAG: glycosyltransferase family 39 protein [Bacteroidota bacterium]
MEQFTLRAMKEKILRKWEENPLPLIMCLAVIFRLLAVIFAKGWGMLDDHFIVIETSQKWVDGIYSDWLPGNPGTVGNSAPTGHNLFYPGIHFLFFSIFKFIGLADPQWKMFVIRLIHASFSLFTVYFGYRIVEELDGKKSARLAGLLLAILWFMPWLSVRNLVEMTCIPFIILGYWMIVREKGTQKVLLSYLLAGLFFGFAINIRPQTVFFPVGIGIVLLAKLDWKRLFAYTSGVVLSISAIQGILDTVVWGYPFAELTGYINVCFVSRNDFISLPWYNCFLTIFGLLIPPMSLYLLFGFTRNWRKHLLFFLPTLIFFAFHSYFPNKQERFILPMIPVIILIGAIGWNEFVSGSKFWQKRRTLMKFSMMFFWVVNIILLVFTTFTYSKKARVESMTYLSRYNNISELLVLDAENSPEMLPLFYLGQWPHALSESDGNHSPDTLLYQLAHKSLSEQPRFILFTGEKDINKVILKAMKQYPGLVYETTIEPGFSDKLVHWMNPVNKNRTMIIYRNAEFFPNKIQ